MISIPILKEIRDYKEKLWLGLTARQLLSTAIAIVVCVPLYIFGIRHIDKEIVSWLVLLIAIPCGGIGFVKYNGMPFEKVIVAIFKQAILYPTKRVFKSDNFFKDILNEDNRVVNTRKKSKNDREASYERTFLMCEAAENGTELDMGSVELLTVRNSSPKKPKKQNDDDETKKESEANKEKKKSAIQVKAEAIKRKIKIDPHYLPTKRDNQILRLYNKEINSQRIQEINRAKKIISKKNKKMEKRRTLHSNIPRSTQDTIPFVADYEEGLIEVEPNLYSKLIKITDINYLTAKEDEQIVIFSKYAAFLNYFSEDYNVAISIDNRIISLNEQENIVLCPRKGDKDDKHRNEYNNVLKRQIVAGTNDIEQCKYVCVTLNADTPYEALIRFRKVEEDVIANLRRIGSNGHVLTTDDRLSILHDKFRKGREGDFKIDYQFIKEQGLCSKDYIAPSSFHFEKDHFMIENEYYRCMYLNNLPSNLSDNFISELTDCTFPLILTLNIQPLAAAKTSQLINSHLTGMEKDKIEAEKKASLAGYSPETINHNLKQAYEQGKELLDQVNTKDQKLFFVTITAMVNGSTLDELEQNCNTIIGKAKKYVCELQTLDWQQEEAFKITIPVGKPATHLSVDRTLTTESTAIFIPFASQELFQPNGFYYGLHQNSRKLILCNRTAMKTPSGFLLGSSGSGKSFAAKREMLNVLLHDDKTGLLVIDPENEYTAFALAFGGTVVSISSDSDNYINPLDMALDYGLDELDDSNSLDIIKKKRKAIKKKASYLMSIVECMISTNNGSQSVITPQQKTLVDRCVSRCYKNYVDNDFKEEFIPTLLDLQNELDKEKDKSEDGRKIAEGVEYYTKGNMDVFSHKTNVAYDNRFVVFNIRDLGTQLVQIALLIVLDFIWNRMIANYQNGIRTYCYVDEIHVLFQNDYSATFLQQLYKRGRKYGLIITGITQNVEDLLRSEKARGMIGNSDFIMMLNQAPEDLKILAPMLHISDTQAAYVSCADEGCGLLFAEKVIVPFVDRFPKDNYLYKLMSTKFGEDKDNKDAEVFTKESLDKFISDNMTVGTHNEKTR